MNLKAVKYQVKNKFNYFSVMDLFVDVLAMLSCRRLVSTKLVQLKFAPVLINAIVLSALLLLSTSCTFMYVPLIPANPQVREARFLMSESKGLSVQEGQLRLDVTIKEIPESNWLAVQWFSPLSKEVASDSEWLEVTDDIDNAQDLRFDLPSTVNFTEGYWRAVVSYQGDVIRQFGLDYSLEVITNDEDVQEQDNSESGASEGSRSTTEDDGNEQ